MVISNLKIGTSYFFTPLEEFAKENIRYRKIRAIVKKTPKIKNERAVTKYPYDGIKIPPFQEFNDKIVAEWWSNYNLVKHARAEEPSGTIPNSQLANLKSVLYALAGLYILCQNLYKLLDESDLVLEPSKLFE